jgi:hypothetical protein
VGPNRQGFPTVLEDFCPSGGAAAAGGTCRQDAFSTDRGCYYWFFLHVRLFLSVGSFAKYNKCNFEVQIEFTSRHSEPY